MFCQGEILLTDAASAEMAKLVENAYRDVNIAFANELSLICDSLQLDVWEVIEMANRHPRVNILTPGPGRRRALHRGRPVVHRRRRARAVAADPHGSRGQRRKPRARRGQVIVQGSRFREPTVACLGLAFKANVDDLRESPAVEIVEKICEGLPDIQVLAVEPYTTQLPARLQKSDQCCTRVSQ